MSEYALDNAWKETRRRLESIEAIYDAHTFAALRAAGVKRGWRCLDIGAGAGSVTRFLAAEAGGEGHVVALDLDPRFLTDMPQNVEVIQGNIAVELPIQPGSLDFAHARLLMLHLTPELRARALSHVFTALRPGGVLIVSDFDHITTDGASNEAFRRAVVALDELLQRHGTDGYYGRKHLPELRAAGFEDTESTGFVHFIRGGDAFTKIYKTATEQLRPKLSLDARAVEEFLRLLDDPTFVTMGPVMVTTRGRKPTASA